MNAPLMRDIAVYNGYISIEAPVSILRRYLTGFAKL
jgi:hypothetical protein